MGDKKYILITGVCGFIGSRMADWIIKNKTEYEVVGIDNLSGGYLSNITDDVIFINADLSKDDIRPIFEKYGFKYVYHFAAYAAEGLSPFMRMFNYSNNVLSTMNVVNNCIRYGVERLVYTSSMSVYGYGVNSGDAFDENDQLNPIDPYGVSKYACEMDIKIANDQHGLDYCIIRPHNVYGACQNIWDVYRNVIGIWMYNILNDMPILIYGDGLQTRAFSYIDDNLPPFWNCADSDKTSAQTINIGGIVPYTINEVCECLCKITNYDKVEYREPRHEVKWAVPTYKKSVDLVGYQQKTSLEEGLRKMWEWAKLQPKRNRKVWSEYEITNGLYSYWKNNK